MCVAKPLSPPRQHCVLSRAFYVHAFSTDMRFLWTCWVNFWGVKFCILCICPGPGLLTQGRRNHNIEQQPLPHITDNLIPQAEHWIYTTKWRLTSAVRIHDTSTHDHAIAIEHAIANGICPPLSLTHMLTNDTMFIVEPALTLQTGTRRETRTDSCRPSRRGVDWRGGFPRGRRRGCSIKDQRECGKSTRRRQHTPRAKGRNRPRRAPPH